MLTFLRVRGFAIIDELEVDFENGFNIITGETGSGKSIIINALSTLINQKISSDVLKTSARQAEIVAHFSYDGKEYILKRIIHTTGRSRAYLNDEPITLGKIEELGNTFLHIYGQNEYRELFEKDRYIHLIDSIAGITDKRMSLARMVKELKELETELKSMIKDAGESSKEISFLEFQIDEIDRANLKDGEEEELRQRIKVLKDAQRIKLALQEIVETLYERDESVLALLTSSIQALKTFNHIDFLKGLKDRMESISYDIEDLYREIKINERDINDDQDELNRTEERLSKIFTIKEKYGKTLNDIRRYRENAQNRLFYLKGLEEHINDTQQKIDSLKKELDNLAGFISDKRKEISPEMARLVMDELKLLAMKNTVFVIDIKDRGYIEEDGKDVVDFLISTNPGEALKPLTSVASGGELSRIMLAIKKVMGGDEKKTLIFDEVDTGIGGMVADMVGQRLKSLSRNHQIICITHLPQIAVYGDCHFLVEKKQMKDYTITNIKRLEDSDRVYEIARMLGGMEITDKTIQRSEEMLENVKKSDH